LATDTASAPALINRNTAFARSRPAGYVIFMAVAIVLLYILNNISTNQIVPIDPTVTTYYSGWLVSIIDKMANAHVPHLTRFFVSCLWAINLCLFFCIIGNFTLLLYRPRWFHHLVMIVINALAMLAVYVIYHVFPFDIASGSTQTLVKILLWVIMALAGVALVVRLVQFVIALNETRTPPSSPDLPISITATYVPPSTEPSAPSGQLESPAPPVEQAPPPPDNALPPGSPTPPQT
jgi:hypothetical protein